MSERDGATAAGRAAEASLPDQALLHDVVALLSALSHDLRAALNGISVWTHILERNGDETTLRAVEGIRRAVTQQSEVAGELSEFGRALGTPGWPPGLQTTGVLHEAAAAARALRPAASVALRMPDELPRTAASAAHLRILIQVLLVDLLLQGGDGSCVTVTAGAAADGINVRFHLAGADGGVLSARGSAPRRTLREVLGSLAARFDGSRIEADGDDTVLSMPSA